MTDSKKYLQKKTKVICTVGPASESKEQLLAMIQKGMNVARLNCSHGNHETLAKWVQTIRSAEEESGVPLPIMVDLQGPKIRIGKMKDGKPVELVTGQKFTISTQNILGDENRVSTSYNHLPQAVKEGDDIFINDGIVHLCVTHKDQDEISTVVKSGGIISDYKGLNIPGGVFVRSGLNHKDKDDIDFAKKNNVEAIAVSFVENAQQLRDVRNYLGEGHDHCLIIAKIERPAAVTNIEEILEEADGVMIARGDLGVEIQLEKVPLTQKEIIQKAIIKKRISIVATQMLESMTHSLQPTRAEVSDVANSIMDHADSLMLSAETAMGKHPVAAVLMMSNIALEIEKKHGDEDHQIRKRWHKVNTPQEALTHSAVSAAHELDIAKIVVFTQTGKTALHLSLRRPHQVIYAFCPSLRVRRQMQFFHGVYPLEIPFIKNLEEQYRLMEENGEKLGLWNKNENLIVLSGPPGITGGTNLLKVHTVGK